MKSVATFVFLLIVEISFAQLYIPNLPVEGTLNSSSGNVGIGTNVPAGKLHLSKNDNNLNTTVDLVLSQFNGYSKISGLYTGTYNGGITFSVNNYSPGENDNNILYKERMRLTSDGNLGIGTPTPRGSLHLSKDVNDFNTSVDLVLSQFNGFSKISGLYTGTYKGGITFSTNNQTNGENNDNIVYYERMRLTADGNVGIGTTNPDAKLAVKGTVHANEVRVDLNVPGPDYVFEKNYALSSLDSVQSYINQNKHLPGVPSAKEMEANGVKLGEMNMLLLKKVEELTLYVIELKEQNDRQQQEIDSIKSNRPR